VADSPTDFDKKLLGDIQKTGFPLELRVAHELLRHGYFIEHNVYYIDKDDNKGREIEISALQNSQNAPRNIVPRWVRNFLTVECKKVTAGKPWVIFSSPVTSYDAYTRTITLTGLKPNVQLDAELLSSVAVYHPYWLSSRLGRSYYEAFKGGPDTERSPNMIFKALTTAVKATISRIDNYRPTDKGEVTFYQPLVVIEGELYEAFLGDNKEIVVTREKWIPISFRYNSPHYQPRRLTVVVIEEPHLSEFIKRLKEALDAWVIVLDQNPKLIAYQPGK
jgi:hypothetical protein